MCAQELPIPNAIKKSDVNRLLEVIDSYRKIVSSSFYADHCINILYKAHGLGLKNSALLSILLEIWHEGPSDKNQF